MPVSDDTGRPEFMATLGLLPPYTLDDVQAAYRGKVMAAHPDRGGTAAEFQKVQQAYERAIEYVEFKGDRRRWIASRVEGHLRQDEVAVEVERLGGRTEFEPVDWMKRSFGDFASLEDRLRVIRLKNTAADDSFLTFLAEQPPRVPFLMELYLAGTRITDKGLNALRTIGQLRRLDLSRTSVTGRGVLAAVRSLPSLEWVGVAGSGVGWLSRWRLSARLRKYQSTQTRHLVHRGLRAGRTPLRRT
jgi:hypothetical protein